MAPPMKGRLFSPSKGTLGSGQGVAAGISASCWLAPGRGLSFWDVGPFALGVTVSHQLGPQFSTFSLIFGCLFQPRLLILLSSVSFLFLFLPLGPDFQPLVFTCPETLLFPVLLDS